MSMPLNEFSPTAVISDWANPDSLGRESSTVDYELGGVALSDPSQGLRVATWRARLQGNEVLVGKSPYTVETSILTASGITELSICFDQNMRPALSYIQSGQAKLQWFDSFVGSQVTTTLDPAITSTYLTMDDKRGVATSLNFNDMLLFYVKGNDLGYRQQRDRFATERILHTFSGPDVKLTKCGMGTGQRVQVEASGLNI